MIGTTLAHYKVTAALGEGGMGQVWRAEDTKLGREVALKVLPEAFAQDPERMARFEREARVLASLNHPNIAHLYGLESISGTETVSQAAAGTGTGSGSGSDSSPKPQVPSPSSHPAAETAAPQEALADGDAIVGHASRVPGGAGGNSKLKTQNSKLTSGAAASEVTFLVMELVEGEDLSERIRRGPIPVEEAVAIALQIAQALEAAHEAGIVHRDLKPANIKLRRDGTVKVLDFGLAKAWETEGPDSGLSLSPTLTARHTAAGLILGTAAYMAPEQAAGIAVDRRADIWSFGVVLWEMLTGHKLFEGETVSHVLASVLKDEVDLEQLPPETPAHLRKLIARCLRKKPRERLQAIGDARIVLEEDEGDAPAATAREAEVPGRSRLAWIVAGSAGLLAAVLGILLWVGGDTHPGVVRASIPAPPGTAFHLDPLNPGVATLSPDGRQVVFSARDESGRFMLYLRALDAGEAHALDGTEGGHYPFWSPDSRWIGFVANGKLRKVPATGGPVQTICDAADGKGGTWNSDGVIVFAPDASSTLHRVAAVGGDSMPITELDLERGDNSHRQPRFLPDGRHLLFYARSSAGDHESWVRVIGLDEGGSGRDLVQTPASARYAAGYLLFVRERTLMAQPFDVSRVELRGEAVPIAENVIVRALTGAGAFSASDNGVLVFQAGHQDSLSRLQWFDSEGEPLETVGDEAVYDQVTLSPDGTTAAVVIMDPASGTSDIWLIDIERGLRTRFTFDKASDTYPVWSPAGDSLIFASRRSGNQALYRKSVRGTGEVELVYRSEADLLPNGWSPDGRYLAFDQAGTATGSDLWILDLESGPRAEVFYQTEAEDGAGVFSPDGRWLAYWSQESGRGEVYVTQFPGPGRRVQVSTNSGTWSQWSSDGRAIYYQEENGPLKRAAVDGRGDTFTVGPVEDVARLEPPTNLGARFAVAPGGDGFLAAVTDRDEDSPHVELVVGWTIDLEDPP